MASEEARKAAADLADALGCEAIARIIRNDRSDVPHSAVAPFLHAFEAFEQRIVERERERCAGICDEQTRLNVQARRDRADDTLAFEFNGLGNVIAAAIRSADHG